jgi:signal transduction histidine kinase
MSFIKTIINRFFKKNETSENNFQIDIVLSQLSHDIKNNFIAIRSLTGNIRNNLSNLEQDAIHSKLKSIDKMLDYAIAHVELTRMRFSTIVNNGSSEEFSILNCINGSLENYPFPSQKCLSHIVIIRPVQDFNVYGNRQIISHLLSCLLKNAVHAIYGLEHAQTSITINKENASQQVFFRIPNDAPLNENNPFSLGLPDRPGAGFRFIEKTIMAIGGGVTYTSESNDHYLIILSFPKQSSRL